MTKTWVMDLSAVTDRLCIAYDDNLGLPAGTAEHLGCTTRAFHDLGELLAALESGEVDAAMIPAGTLPYVQAAPYRHTAPRIVAQATLPGGRTRLTSVLVTTAPDTANASQTLGRRLARVNRYCTTSYWAPLITMVEHTPRGTRVEFVDAAGFADMVVSTMDGRSDAAMVWDHVLARHPELVAASRQVLRTDELPTPVVVVAPQLSAERRAALGRVLVGLGTPATGPGLEAPACAFDGFVAPEHTSIDRFTRRMRRAIDHFDVRVADPVG